MLNTLLMLLLICLLATLLLADFIVVIPKFGSQHFGAPEDIKTMVQRAPDRPMWVNVLGVCIMLAGFAGVAAVLVWAAVDTVRSGMGFGAAFLRFLIITEGYKLFDILCFDYLMLNKLKLPAKLYPETAGAKGYNSFGFNAISQITKLIAFFAFSLLMAVVLTVLI